MKKILVAAIFILVHKLHSEPAPEVECLAKIKAHKKYE
jgi:hypothetical protein